MDSPLTIIVYGARNAGKTTAFNTIPSCGSKRDRGDNICSTVKLGSLSVDLWDWEKPVNIGFESNIDGIIIMYDLQSQESVDDAIYFLTRAGMMSKVVPVLVQTKRDLTPKVQLPRCLEDYCRFEISLMPNRHDEVEFLRPLHYIAGSTKYS